MKKVLFIPLLITVIVAQTVDYDTDIQPLWNANCTSCHGANGSGGLNLSTGQSYDNLVDVASSGNGYDGALRVASGDADNSVLYDKITNGGTYGGQMPPSALMSSANRTLVQTWINELSSANYITIAAARNQDEGTSVTVRGIVTTPNFQSSNTEYGLQDGTGGIIIFHFSAPYVELAVGDSVEVTGELDIYNGKTEVIPSSADDITVISQNNDLPDFQVVTVADYVANAEDYESELIKINAVSITEGSWPTGGSSNLTISDDGGTSTVTMRIDSDMDIIGNDEPAAPFDVRGIAGQFDGSDPYDSGYQILPRYYTDFTPGEDVVDPPDLVINEFLAKTDLCCDDGNGEMEDFIEIYNPGDEAVDIGGLWITDDLDDTGNWEQIPTTDASITTVAAGGHIVIWADEDQDSQGILHTADIKLSGGGEEIGLIFISGTDTIFVDSLSFGEQTDDISYGRYPDGSANWEFFNTPTPGAANQTNPQTITSIYDIQYVADPSTDDESPLNGQEVTISGVVTTEFWGGGNSHLYVQDAAGGWNGIIVYQSGGWDEFDFSSPQGTVHSVAEGDSVTLTGTVGEYYGLTQIKDVTQFMIHGPADVMIEPTVVTPGQVMTGGTDAEKFESCLIAVHDVSVDNPDLGYGEWSVTDGTNSVRVDDRWDYYFWPEGGQALAEVVGCLDYSFSNTKIQPRLARDVVEDGVTRIQRINQVLYSDLLKVSEDNISDQSYFVDEIVTVEGIVTVATELSFAGDGVKIVFEDYNGGPWSGMVCFDETGVELGPQPIGRLVRVTGTIAEYGHSDYDGNVTEIFTSQPIQPLGLDTSGISIDTIQTGDLRDPLSGEQWGAVWVEINDAMVIQNDLEYGQWTIDDGTGEIKIGTSSAHPQLTHGFWDGWERPPEGSFIQSIRGWVYNRHGFYGDSTAFKLEPNRPSDIVFGAGPPIIREVMRDPCVVLPSDQVEVTTSITDNSSISQAFVHFRFDGGAWDSVAMSLVNNDTWLGTIPASSSDNIFVEYYISSYDDGADQASIKHSYFPNIDDGNYMGYRSKSGDFTIHDVQYSPWPSGVSPYLDCFVTVTGIVTSDSEDYESGSFNSYALQSESAQWSGLFFDGDNIPSLTRGDEITLTGKVYEYYGSTSMDSVTNINILSSNNAISPLMVSTSDLSENADELEAYEGCLVNVSNVTVTSVNQYDWSIADNSNISCLMDDDMATMEADNYMSSLAVDDMLSTVSGIFNYSYGTYKIEVRDIGDLGELGIDGSDGLLNKYALYPNYPNPFNPETKIHFQLANNSDVQLIIYDILGRKIRTLVSNHLNVGNHVVTWNGLDEDGANVASGMYIYRIEAGDFIDYRKMLLVR